MNQTYFELNTIVKKFPFLKYSIRENCSLFNIFNKEDFDDIDKFCAEYDTEEDLCGLMAWGWNYTKNVDASIKLMYNLINRRDFDTLELFQEKFRIGYILLNKLNFNPDEFDHEITTELKKKYNVISDIVSVLYQSITRYWNEIYSLVSPKQIIAQLKNTSALDYMDKLNSYFYSKSYFSNVTNHSFIKTSYLIVKYILNVGTESDAEELKEIFQKHLITAKFYCIGLINNDISDPTVKNIFSNHDNDDEFYNNLKVSVTTSKLHSYIRQFVEFIDTDSKNISFVGLGKFIDICILQNPKIKDAAFPLSKKCVVHEFLTKLLFAKNLKIDQFKNHYTYIDFVEKFSEYIYDPYFITSIELIPKFYTTASAYSLVTNLFTNTFMTHCNDFVNDYFDEIDKPVSDRKITVYDSDPKFISYGALYNILTNGSLSFYKLDMVNSKKPNVRLFYTILTQPLSAASKEFNSSYDYSLKVANNKYSFYNNCKFGNYTSLKNNIIKNTVYSNVSMFFEFIESEKLSPNFYDMREFYNFQSISNEDVELAYQYIRLDAFSKIAKFDDIKDYDMMKNYVFKYRKNVVIEGETRNSREHQIKLSKFYLYLKIFRLNDKNNSPLTFSVNKSDFISGFNNKAATRTPDVNIDILKSLSAGEMRQFKSILVDGLLEDVQNNFTLKYTDIFEFCINNTDKDNEPVYVIGHAYDELLLKYKIENLISEAEYTIAKENLDELRSSYKCKNLLQ